MAVAVSVRRAYKILIKLRGLQQICIYLSHMHWFQHVLEHYKTRLSDRTEILLKSEFLLVQQ